MTPMVSLVILAEQNIIFQCFCLSNIMVPKSLSEISLQDMSMVCQRMFLIYK